LRASPNHLDDVALRALRRDDVSRKAGDETRDSSLTAERIGLGGVAFDEDLIDDGDEVVACVFRGSADAATKEWNAEREVFGMTSWT
jgi:hypothetical protein